MHDRGVLEAALERLQPKKGSSSSSDNDNTAVTKRLATAERLRGLLSSCHEELPDCPLFYRLPDLSQVLHVSTPPVTAFQSALVHAGYRASGYHKDPQAIKTDAPPTVVWDILRAWAKKNPPAKAPKEGSVDEKILAVEPNIEVNFTAAKSVLENRNSGVKRFPGNPQANWGPKKAASGKKRKAEEEAKKEDE